MTHQIILKFYSRTEIKWLVYPGNVFHVMIREMSCNVISMIQFVKIFDIEIVTKIYQMLFEVKRKHEIIDIEIDQILESKLTLDLRMIISFTN